MELLPREKDATNGEMVFGFFAVIAAWAGEKDLALQQLNAAIPLPGATFITSYGILKLMPFWDRSAAIRALRKSSRLLRRNNSENFSELLRSSGSIPCSIRSGMIRVSRNSLPLHRTRRTNKPTRSRQQSRRRANPKPCCIGSREQGCKKPQRQTSGAGGRTESRHQEKGCRWCTVAG
jgi:hypothetical protein